MSNSLKLFGLFVATDILSALAYYLPILRNGIFIILVFLFFILTWRRLEYGLAIMFAELFIGSKGYLFSFSGGETLVSIRVALFIILFSIFLAKLFFKSYPDTPVYRSDGYRRDERKLLFIIGLFFTAIFFGILNGLWRGHGFGPVFLDANGYFFLFLIFPVLYLINSEESRTWLRVRLSLILSVGAAWLALKTLILFTLFVRGQDTVFLGQAYSWIRNTVGEITPAGNGLYRIFIQSQLYIVLVYLLFLTRREFRLMGGSIYLAAILVSLSRSFWLGVIIAYSLQLITYSLMRNWKPALDFIKRLFVSAMLAVIILAIIYLPSLVSVGERTKNLIGEPAVSSRIAQFRPLVKEILKSPILGHGFGKTITYQTSDPRILKSNPTGEYTTYAFELGYLDTLLKIGLLGFAMYLFLIYKIWNKTQVLGLRLGLTALLIINIFSPYLNHPLGIGFLLLAMIWGQDSTTPTISG